MKILHVIASMDPVSGGPCQGIRNSNQELTKLGIDREVVCLDEPNASFLGKDPFPVHALGAGITRWCYNPKLYHWLVQNIPLFDIIILNGLWLYNGYAVRKALQHLNALKKAGKMKAGINPRFYIMTHGMLDPYFQKASYRKLKAIRNWVYWKLIENKVINYADGLLFTCETEMLLAREPFRPYNPKREINIGYGIATPPAYTTAMKQAFAEKCPGIGDSNYLLFLSRIHKKKGIDLLIKAYTDAAKKAEATGQAMPKLVIAGPGVDTPYGKQMEQLSIGWESSILFTGMLESDAKWGAFYGSDAFILPSHQENFGIAVVEALACSKPVLISTEVNIWHEVKEDNAGIIAPDTLEGTKELLDKWIDLGLAEKEEMKNKALRCFEQKFEISFVSRQFIQAIMPGKIEVLAYPNELRYSAG